MAIEVLFIKNSPVSKFWKRKSAYRAKEAKANRFFEDMRVAGAEFDTKHKKEYKGIRLKKVLTLNFKGFAAVTSSVFATIAASFGRYDVVHIHAEGPAFMCWLPKLFRKKVVVTIHGLDHLRAKWGKMASTYIMMGEKNAVRFADSIIVLSKEHWH